MKYMNMRKRHWRWNLQLFADGTEDGGAAEDDDSDDGTEDGSEDDPDEKKFTQKDVDDAVKKRIARERRKWQREQQEKTSGQGADGGSSAGGNDKTESDDARLKEAESRALKAETRAACFEAGVDKGAIDDVTALARSYMAADEDLDLEDAIERVVKKYPHFKKASESDNGDDGARKKSWGERQRGSGSKLTGVEAAFLKKNPGLKY